MIVGIGLDIVEIKRIRELFLRQEKLKERILTEKEQEIFAQLPEKRKFEFLAGRFAAKEAFSKAYGTGIGKALSFHDIEIVNDEKGKPYFTKPNQFRAHLSISHSDHYAVAQVIIEDSP
ncbi:holo-ACP synthase [Fervidibacillus halotolerans]|uniref:Holo-[acyl-carrier-protein] synthase n=1 Tax=Fervidibacillus halotolerans TaxID=2980027 RepID=A0A9E8M098_9BACI|nr:holo-ACP synthase [Fervidibacillus halotolerans]WAA12560.1 holo-ACP synthase [Fervidibacillus halotolerans]